jgi:protein-S-isoprenylcysteine O-methyltransferase Ste14
MRIEMTTLSNWAIIACWIIFIGYWGCNALRVKPAAEKQSWLSLAAFKGPQILGGMLLWCQGLYDPLRLALTPHTDLARAGGAVVCVFGLFVAVWSRRTLAGNWSSNVTFRQGHELIKAGPYRFVRHPIYTGILLMCFGQAIANGRLQAWLGFLILCIGFWIKLQQEESLLLRHFPGDYSDYRKRVKALVPFLI